MSISKEPSIDITMQRQQTAINRYYWAIKDMSKFNANNSLESPEFTFRRFDGVEQKFKLKLLENDSDGIDSDIDSDGAELDDFDLLIGINIDLEFQAMRKYLVVRSIADKNGKIIHSEQVSTTKIKANSKFQKKYYLIDDFDIKCLCFENKIIILDVNIIDITSESAAISAIANNSGNTSRVSEPRILDHFAKFYQTKDFCDFTLEVEDKEYYVHKVVLAATSPVFAAIFIHEKKDANNSLKIIDAKKETVEEMLRYMYTGQAINLKNVAVDLLKIADKYDIEGLMKLCIDYLRSKINVDNVLRTLALAIKYNLEELKLEAHAFFMINPKAILDGSEFNQFMNSYAFSNDILL